MSDMTKPAKQAVLDLINSENGLGLTDEQVTLGLPTVNPTGKNTTITITAVSGKGYTGSQNVDYNRLSLSDILTQSGKDATFVVADTDKKIADIVPRLNALLLINLGPDDFVDGDLPTFTGGIPNETKVVQLVAKNDSLAYIASLAFNLKNTEISLSTVITKTDLNGLTYVPPGA